MEVGEYLIVFAAILVGLALADLSLSLHRLMRQGRVIKWHPIVPLTGFIVLCLILNFWWGLYRNFAGVDEIRLLEFLPTVFTVLVLFLLAATVFPDEKLPKGASLKEYYLGNRFHFWGLLATYLALAMLTNAIKGVRVELGWEEQLINAAPNGVWLALCLVLMFTKRMLVHWCIVLLSLAVILLAWYDQRIVSLLSG